MHQAELWKPMDDGRVQCRLCSHFCRIADGERGTCGVRFNQDGTLYTLVYDKIVAANLDPVEKKPLYHFHPGSLTFSLGTMGCNMGCSFCQNASISEPPRRGKEPTGQDVTPEGLVQAALDSDALSIAYTYTEPTIFFELMRDTATLAHERGLKNIMVSNGFMSPQCLDALDGLIDAANIDLKAFTEAFYQNQCGARLDPVLKNLKQVKEMGWWLEVTTLLVTGLNDSAEEVRDIAGFIAGELGAETPWHISRFHPTHRLRDRPSTPLTSLEQAHDAGKEAGLRYVYIGNVPGNDAGHTLCHACGDMLINRMGFTSRNGGLKDGACKGCGAAMAGVGLP